MISGLDPANDRSYMRQSLRDAGDSTTGLLLTGEMFFWDGPKHRGRKDPSMLRALSLFLILAVIAGFVTTSVIPEEQPSRALRGPVTVAPLSFPDPPAVEAPTASSEPSAEPSRADDRATRTRKAETKPQVSKIEAVISFALAQLGDRYSWAAAGPNAYDCSGLVKAAFRVVGLELYHYTGRQMTYGTKVSRAQLQRGDIVFPTAGHVGIYLGNNQMVAASSGKGRVAISSVYSFYTARRLL